MLLLLGRIGFSVSVSSNTAHKYLLFALDWNDTVPSELYTTLNCSHSPADVLSDISAVVP